MKITKEIKDDHEFYLWFNGKLIYKKWLKTGNSIICDHGAWGSYTTSSFNDFDLENTPDLIIVRASLKLFSTDEGGRKTAISSGYRPNHVFEYESNERTLYTYIGDIQFNEAEIVNPGDEKEVTVRFLAHQSIEKYLEIGRKWWIHEGSIKIGEATILDITL